MNTYTCQLNQQLKGDFDALAVDTLRPVLDAIVDTDTNDVHIDLSDINFIDSSGIGALVFLFKRLRSQNRHLTLGGATGQPLELLQYLRIDRSIKFH